jgi:sporulation protein YlmC with PRC-barrel domain
MPRFSKVRFVSLHRREGWLLRPLLTLIAALVATIALGTAVASAADHSWKLAPWPQLAQATEAPRDETGGCAAPADVTTAVLEQQDVEAVLGRQVRSIAGEDIGRVVNVVVDRGGQVRAAIIDFGGFLGVGNRKIAVDWNALRFPTADHITLDLTRDQVKAAPEYKDGRPLVVIGTTESPQSYPASE